eukprot:COSAG01_NODE_1913_length_8922_cov_30.042049_3_plen_87_part_00
MLRRVREYALRLYRRTDATACDRGQTPVATAHQLHNAQCPLREREGDESARVEPGSGLQARATATMLRLDHAQQYYIRTHGVHSGW